MSLTDAIASCKDGLGFLLAELPKIRFISQRRGEDEQNGWHFEAVTEKLWSYGAV